MIRFFTRIVHLVVFTYLLASFTPSFAGNRNGIDDFIAAIENNKLSGVAVYFTETISIAVPQRSGIYQKKQGEQIIKDFFSNHPVTKITEKERTNFNGGMYYTAVIHTKNGNYQMTIFQKTKNGNSNISEIRITAS